MIEISLEILYAILKKDYYFKNWLNLHNINPNNLTLLK